MIVNNSFVGTLVCLSTLCCMLVNSTLLQVDRPLGVSLTKKVFYNPDTDFTCLDGSKTISFSYVNDDYCDCPDGSDEPGTSACPNGFYHCTNAGYHPKNIPSSRVNDGICDCCDGSDEWQNEGLCANTCTDLWRAERAIMAEKMEHQNKGYEVRKQYSAQGVQKKAERQKKISDINAKLQEFAEIELTLKSEKDALEVKENAMISEAKKAIALQKAEEMGDAAAMEIFTKMDANGDGTLTADELVSHKEYDPYPADNVFTTSEAKSVLTKGQVDASEFIEIVWPSVMDKSDTAKEDAGVVPPDEDDDDSDIDGEDLDGDDDFDDDDEDFDGDDDDDSDFDADEADSPPEDNKDDDSNEYEYDEDTKDMIAQATQAREELKKVTDAKDKLQKEINEINKSLKMDFGPDECFQAIHHQCFEFITMEYKYKLCPFEKTTQAPKKGGSETPLGRWGRWDGPADNIHGKMMYENGQGCWNGPNRSTQVILSCGVENKVTSVDEPSRCKYVFEFSTPCACAAPIEASHDEL